MNLKYLNSDEIQAHVNELETELGRNLTDVSTMSFFDIQDYADELQKEIDHEHYCNTVVAGE